MGATLDAKEAILAVSSFYDVQMVEHVIAWLRDNYGRLGARTVSRSNAIYRRSITKESPKFDRKFLFCHNAVGQLCGLTAWIKESCQD